MNILHRSAAAYRLPRREGISRVGPEDPIAKRQQPLLPAKISSPASKKSKTFHVTAKPMADSRSFLHDMRLDQTLCYLPIPAKAESSQKFCMCNVLLGNGEAM